MYHTFKKVDNNITLHFVIFNSTELYVSRLISSCLIAKKVGTVSDLTVGITFYQNINTQIKIELHEHDTVRPLISVFFGNTHKKTR